MYYEKPLLTTPRGYFCIFLNHTLNYSRNYLPCTMAAIYGCTDLPCDLSVALAHKKMFNACHKPILVSMLWKWHCSAWFLNVLVQIRAVLLTRRWCSVKCLLWSQSAWVQIPACRWRCDWASYLTSLSFGFLICKLGIIVKPTCVTLCLWRLN